MRTIERLATTPYGTDPEVDAILDGAVVIFNVIQNPDGRVVGQRANGNGFDLNRDFLTQSQSETKASVRIMQEWLPAGDARPARLRHADADRGDDEAAQPGDRLRPLAEVEPVAHRRERGGAERRQPQRHSPDQRLVLRRQHLGAGRDLPGRPAGRSGGRRELGRLGPVLHADVLAARRPQRLDGRDVQQHVYVVEPAQPLLPERRPGPGEEPDRPQRVAAGAARDDAGRRCSTTRPTGTSS